MTVLSGVRHSGNKHLGHLLPLLNGDRCSYRRDQIEPTPQAGSVSLETSLFPSTHRRANGASCIVHISGGDQSQLVVFSSDATSQRCGFGGGIFCAWDKNALRQMGVLVRGDNKK